MKTRIIVYWISTILIALETLAGGVLDLAHGPTNAFGGTHVVSVVKGLGYPVYLLVILGVWKIPGAVTLVAPGLRRLKEWAYAGIVFELSGAAASHAACGQWSNLVSPLVLLGLALVSWALRPAARTLGAGVSSKN